MKDGTGTCKVRNVESLIIQTALRRKAYKTEVQLNIYIPYIYKKGKKVKEKKKSKGSLCGEKSSHWD